MDLQQGFDKSKVICVDLETTGLNQETDEILQLSIIDGNYNVLFNEYIRPKHKKEWRGAALIHKITPDKVKDLPTIDTHIEKLNKIFSECELVVGYNIEQFDAGFLIGAGITIPDSTYYYDVMLEFAEIYGDWNEYFGDYEWQKLRKCAAYYKYDWGNDITHNSLAFAKATLYCFEKMIST